MNHHFYSKGPARVYHHPKGIPFFKCGWRPGITESFTPWNFDSELTPEKLHSQKVFQSSIFRNELLNSRGLPTNGE